MTTLIYAILTLLIIALLLICTVCLMEVRKRLDRRESPTKFKETENFNIKRPDGKSIINNGSGIINLTYERYNQLVREHEEMRRQLIAIHDAMGIKEEKKCNTHKPN